MTTTTTTTRPYELGHITVTEYDGSDLRIVQASSMAQQLGAYRNPNLDPYARSVAVIMDRTGVFALARILRGGGDAEDLKYLAAMVEPLRHAGGTFDQPVE